MNTSNDKNNPVAKPFLKWAGGKAQLIPAIEAALPADLHEKKKLVYVEPFIGSGAVLFWFLQKFPQVQQAVINDINTDLIKAYQVVKNEPCSLVQLLDAIAKEYEALLSEECRKAFFLDKREAFNRRNLDDIRHTALLVFLNRTCFNGLYRVNSKNQFNVPFGKHHKPRICDSKTIFSASKLLQKVIILNGDYQQTLPYASQDAFFYFDPPYKPISPTSSFNSYAKESFGDKEQIRLKEFCDTLSSRSCRWLLSNSDPKNNNPEDDFFDELYRESAVRIDRVKAKRFINSKGSARGEIAELLISNYSR